MVLWGKAMGAVLASSTSRCLLRRQKYVFMPAATFTSLLLKPGDIFVDVGAYDGLISLVAAHAVGSAGRVYSFEPNPAAFARLQCIIRAYALTSVHAQNYAIAAEDGTATLYVPKGDTEATLSEASPLAEGAASQPCRVRTLDAFWREQSETAPLALLKIDVEGAELDVLAGAQTLLSSSSPPMVIFEASDANASTFGKNRRRRAESSRDVRLSVLDAAISESRANLAIDRNQPRSKSRVLDRCVLAVNPKAHGAATREARGTEFPLAEGSLSELATAPLA